MFEEQVRADPGFAERYTLEERLGSGAMGNVWRGTQRALSRPVAIKFMSPDLVNAHEWRERFSAEARAVATLIHSNVTAVFDFGIACGVPYLVTELVSGEPLDRLLVRSGALSPADRVDVVDQVLSALEAVHELGILHRDLKPSNIMVGTRRPPHAKLMDFGIAKKLDEERGLTRVGIVLGSPPYMSPEQALGKKLAPASDLYALTVVFYEMVLGHVPFQAELAVDTIRLRLEHDAVIPDDLLPSVAAVLRRGLSRDPAARLSDARSYRRAFAEAVRDVKAVGSFYPASRTIPPHFLSQGVRPPPATLAGTAAAKLTIPATQPHTVPGPITPAKVGAGRKPEVAIAILTGLLVIAVAARAHRHAERQQSAPSPSAASSPSASATPSPAASPGARRPWRQRLRSGI